MSYEKTTTMIFDRKADAVRVQRRLRDFNLLSYLKGKEVQILVPEHMEREAAWQLAGRIYRQEV